ncbi:MAG: hypothetical protein SOR58_09510 [Megasphaera massiliensis]|uniref:hypothetical protein n=1 Tax=Megasphaera massiliensis TaxID=1232428 RepID=UPI002A75D914|nr:hypothetical protein [Megasphaera massiliensis]MDY2966417.1 hypothetical protein [Megasphaera massiliensis]
MTQEKWQDTLISIKNKMFTARNAKIAAAFIVVAVIAGAGGRYYLHQRHMARHEEQVAAMADLTQAQAKQKGVSLINEEQARAAAAKAIGKDESQLDFKEVALFDMDSMKHKDGREEHRKDRRGERGPGEGPDQNEKGRPNMDERMRPGQGSPQMGPQDHQGGAPALQPPQELTTPQATAQQDPQQGQAVPQGQQTTGQQPAAQQGQQPGQPMQPGFHPMYKVRAVSGSVHYDILIDAVTGSVIHTQIDD